jgi:hypothetical protein
MNQGQKHVENHAMINNLEFMLSLKNHNFIKMGFSSKSKPFRPNIDEPRTKTY